MPGNKYWKDSYWWYTIITTYLGICIKHKISLPVQYQIAWTYTNTKTNDVRRCNYDDSSRWCIRFPAVKNHEDSLVPTAYTSAVGYLAVFWRRTYTLAIIACISCIYNDSYNIATILCMWDTNIKIIYYDIIILNCNE